MFRQGRGSHSRNKSRAAPVTPAPRQTFIHHQRESVASDRFNHSIGPIIQWIGGFSRRNTPGSAMSLLHILLERIDPSQNMARFYVLSIEPTLFGDSALVREWGRIGSSSQRRSELFSQQSEAHLALDAWLKRKRRRGYQQR